VRVHGLPALADVAGAAVFLASTEAGAMTGGALNLSGGSLAD
jgi:3-oxoacyl-[acyl-carrier protein] reductase